MTGRLTRVLGMVVATVVVAGGCSGGDGGEEADSGDPSTTSEDLAADVVLGVGEEVVAELDPRYQSYNVEMVEVTGGEFWQPLTGAIVFGLSVATVLTLFVVPVSYQLAYWMAPQWRAETVN